MSITPTQLTSELAAAIRAAIEAQPNAYGRSRVIYNIVRECYDAVKRINDGDDTPERRGVGKISDAEDEHEYQMDLARRPQQRE